MVSTDCTGSLRERILKSALIGFSVKSQGDAAFLACKPAYVGGPPSDLAVTSTASNTSPTVGQNITFTIVASNNTAGGLAFAQVQDPVPNGITFVSSGVTQGAYDSTTGVWSVGLLNGNSLATLQIVGTVNRAGTITNTATIGTAGLNADPNLANNTATSTVNASAPANPPPGNTPCFCTGTRILAERGPIAVEDLAIGDRVVTAGGRVRPIRWIGTRSYSGRFANTNPSVMPVCVRAGALEDGIPARDLWVSPDHALVLDGLLVPAALLVNGGTITRAERVEGVTYWHVELDDHDVLIAEGAPAESFVDDGGRAIFHNASSYRALYPGAAVPSGPPAYCAPRVADDSVHGHALEAIRRRLALRAGLAVAPERVFGALRGRLEACDGRRVVGWAQDAAHPAGPVCLDVIVDGVVVALVYAEDHRADLEASGIGDGRHAFDLDLPAALDPAVPHVVELRRSVDGASLGTLRLPAAGMRAA